MKLSRRPAYFLAIFTGGGIAGLLNVIVAMVLYSQTRDASPLTVLQVIASGLYGQAALQHGLISAIIGLVVHMAISFIAAGIYVSFMRIASVLFRSTIGATVAFSIGVYIVMDYIVVPLSATVFSPSTDPIMIGIRFLILVFTFGVPIALSARVFATPLTK